MTCWYLGGAVAVPQGPDAAAAGDEAMTPIAASTAAAIRKSLIRTSTSRRMVFPLGNKPARG
jgi:hypothetical protein